MMKLRGKSGNGRWLALYTAMFLVGMTGVGIAMLMYGRTLVWIGGSKDGLKQLYTVIGYVGQVLRDMLSGEGYKMIDFSLGQGLDVLTTTSYYGSTDPLSLLSIFAKEDSIEVFYVVIDFLRAYLAGCFCGMYLRKMRVHESWAVACGCAVYSFSGYVIWMLGRHPYFINGALYLPLLLLGIERVFEDRKWLMFTLVAALMLIVNFYFAFMNTVVAVLYIIVRLLVRIREYGVKESAKDGFTLLGSYLLGAALSGVVFLPVARLFLFSSRVGVESGYSGSVLHYGLNHYLTMFASMFAPWDFLGSYTLLNYLPVALFGVLSLFFIKERRAKGVLAAIAVCLVAAGIPAVGYLMNGFAYVSNRWVYITAVFVALASGMGLPALIKPDSTWRKKVALIALGYVGLLLIQCVLVILKRGSTAGTPNVMMTMIFIAAFAALLLIYDSGRIKAGRMKMLTSAFLTVLCVVYSASVYLPRGYDYIREQDKWGIWDRVVNETAANLIEDDGIYRVGQGGYDDAQAVLLDYMGTCYYWSLVDGGNSAHYIDLGLSAQRSSNSLESLGGNSAVNTLAAVKYYVRNAGQDYVIPYGFERIEDATLPNGEMAEVYENRYALPLGYVFDDVMPKAEYDKLPVESKIQALTRYAVRETDGAGYETGFTGSALECDYQMIPDDLVDCGEQGHIHAKKNGTLKFSFEGQPDSETYLILEGFLPDPKVSGSLGSLTVRSRGGMSIGYVPNRSSNFYFEKPNIVFCLGSEEIDSCELIFDNRHHYTYDNIRIVSIPLEDYRRSAAALQAEGMEQVQLANNRISGTVSVEDDRILQIAVPYSDGWTAKVNGEEVEVFRCGGMYMGIDLKAGTNAVEMEYATPGLKEGAVISALALVLTVALKIGGGLKRNRKRRGDKA